MKVLFIAANTEQINMPVMPLGLACVAEAAARAGHDTAMIDLMVQQDTGAALEKAIADFEPQCIAVSVRNIDDQKMKSPRFLLDDVRATVLACKQLSPAPIVVGGAGYSIFPEPALAYLGADLGIAGEGEAAFTELLCRLEQRRDLSGIPGLVLPGRGVMAPVAHVSALDDWSLPRMDFLSLSASLSEMFWIPVQTRRGCPLRCSYCSTPAIEGAASRRRSPEYVADWLQTWVRAGFRRFFFVDNTFNFPSSYARQLCLSILEKKLPIHWRAIIYPKQVDRDLVKLMADSGCTHISLGFESGAPAVLKGMNKKYTPDEVRAVSRMFADHGIERMGFLLLGGPDETRETVEETLDFATSLQLDLLEITVGIRIYPDTPLAARARAEGLLAPDDDLLRPRFYLAEDIKDWITPRVTKWARAHGIAYPEQRPV